MEDNRKPLKLAVDIHHLMLEHAGTKRVTLNLLGHFQERTDIDLVELRPSYSLERGSGIFSKIHGHLTRFFWVHLHLPYLCRQQNVDVLLSPEFNTPLYTHCKRAVIAHDAHMRAQRNFTSTLWFYFYYIPFIELAIRRADLIFTVSRFAKKQIVELMRLDEKKVVVCYNTVDDIFLQPASPQRNDHPLPDGLQSRRYILFTGTFETRKNIERLIEAFARIKKENPAAEDLKLAIAGHAGVSQFSDRSRQIHNLIERLDIRKEVILCGFVPDEVLPLLYRDACVLAFTSLHEGFGLPILEGFASGVPVLTSNLCSMPEIAGGAALLCDPYSVEDIKEKLEQLIFDPQLRQRYVIAGYERLKEFTRESPGSRMLGFLKTLV